MELDAQADRLLDSQPDYIRDLHRRLQRECRRAGVPTGPASDTLGLGFASEAAGTRRRWPEQEAAQSPRMDLGMRWGTEGSPDDCAGCGHVRRFPSPCPPAAVGVPKVPPIAANKPLADVAGVSATPRGAASVAKEVLRLRLARRQHEDLRAQLAKAEAQLRRLPPNAISQFLSYLEKNLGDPELAVHVQEAIANLIECLCAVCKVELASVAPEGLLSGARRLLRDSHGFAKKLCAMPPRSSVEAEGLAPFLLAEVQYRKVREKDVNASYEALHSWLTAFYFFSAVSDQVSMTEKELERQEGLLRRLDGGQAEDPPASGRVSSPAVSPRAKPRASFQAPSSAAKARAPLQGARGELARSPPPPASGARIPGGSGPGAPGRGLGPRGARSPGASSRPPRPGVPDFGSSQAAASGLQPAAQLPRMQSLQSDALLTYLRARKKEGGPPPPGSGYSQQALPPEQLQQEARFQGGIHRRSSAPAFKDWEALRCWQEA